MLANGKSLREECWDSTCASWGAATNLASFLCFLGKYYNYDSSGSNTSSSIMSDRCAGL